MHSIIQNLEVKIYVV